MENGNFKPKNEVEAMSRRKFLEKAANAATSAFGLRVAAGLGLASGAYGVYESHNAVKKEGAAKEVMKTYPRLPRNVEIARLRRQLDNEEMPEGQRKHAEQVIEDAEKRKTELDEIGSPGVSKVRGAAATAVGLGLLIPYMLRFWHQEKNS